MSILFIRPGEKKSFPSFWILCVYTARVLSVLCCVYLKQIIPLKHPVKEFNCFNIGTVSGHNYGSPIQTAGNRKMLKKSEY